MFQLPPEPFTHWTPVWFGRVTAEPDEEAVEAVVSTNPFAVYPVPVSSAPDADAVESADVSFIEKAPDDEYAVHVVGFAPVAVGRLALRKLVISGFEMPDMAYPVASCMFTGDAAVFEPGRIVIVSGRHTMQPSIPRPQ